MVPLKDDNPVRITPYITYGLIAVNIACFLIEASLNSGQLEQFLHQWALVPNELSASFAVGSSASGLNEWQTLISSQFLHGGILHLGGNMLYLWIFGNNLEEQMGRLRYLSFYLLCGVLAALTQWFFAPASTVPSLGASGAIAGVMGAYIFRFPRISILTLIPLGILFFPVRIPAIFYLGIWFLQQAFYGLLSLGAPMNIGMESGGIAYWAHAGGFVFGALLGPVFGLFRGVTSRQQDDM